MEKYPGRKKYKENQRVTQSAHCVYTGTLSLGLQMGRGIGFSCPFPAGFLPLAFSIAKYHASFHNIPLVLPRPSYLELPLPSLSSPAPVPPCPPFSRAPLPPPPPPLQRWMASALTILLFLLIFLPFPFLSAFSLALDEDNLKKPALLVGGSSGPVLSLCSLALTISFYCAFLNRFCKSC